MNPTHTNLHDHAPAFHDLFDLLTKHGTDAMAHAFAATLNIAMRLEREQHLDAGEFQRSANRTGYANGYKPKQMDTPAGRVTVQVPKTRPLPGRTDDYESFFPQALSRGTRACRAVNATLAAMYVGGVSTRDVKNIMTELGLDNATCGQVSRATAELDEELHAWRERPLGTVERLILDARYEKVREGGVVRDVAVLSAVGILPEGSARCSASRSRSPKPRFTGATSSTRSSPAACGAWSWSSATITPGCKPPARPCCPPCRGSGASSTWRRTPSTTRPRGR